jgi:hypothetical protein
MNQKTHTGASGAAIAFIVASVIFAVLVVAVKLLVNVPAIDADSAAVRTKALAEIRATESKSLNNAGWVDESRGIVRIPIATAIQIAAQEWQNPAAARADLIAREEKASAPAPVVAPKPNPFE